VGSVVDISGGLTELSELMSLVSRSAAQKVEEMRGTKLVLDTTTADCRGKQRKWVTPLSASSAVSTSLTRVVCCTFARLRSLHCARAADRAEVLARDIESDSAEAEADIGEVAAKLDAAVALVDSLDLRAVHDFRMTSNPAADAQIVMAAVITVLSGVYFASVVSCVRACARACVRVCVRVWTSSASCVCARACACV
jgi:hypothetical protein